ncbi:glycosyltransferase family 1 protein [Vibrio parahaemolyticus]|nr:glycosyltransferase family 1 protein [Vibrio parahaemolyticus]
MKRLLINASNLHVGGGVQVATSFIVDLSKMDYSHDLNIICSTVVHENLKNIVDVTKFGSFKIIDSFGFRQLPSEEIENIRNDYDVCFSIFGPIYHDIPVKYHICGFAQAWIAYPKNEAYSILSKASQFKARIKFFIQKYYFKKYDHLVVELPHVKSALCRIGFKETDISIIYNSISTIYSIPNLWREIPDVKMQSNIPTIGFVGRAYPHKNLAILHEVAEILTIKYEFRCNFLFTLTKSEMEALGFNTLDNFYTVGSIQVEQCPNFYKKLDAFIFPSLLECYSVSPVESMIMSVPVIASRREFVSDICGDAAYYFDPQSADSIAKSIYEAFNNDVEKERKLKIGKAIVKDLPSSRDRTNSYINLLKTYLSKIEG